ncbi:MAG: putative methyltransferase [Candidatus Heimdallarchaeota archaeon]|nr:MAG: putative methyltransferase [Candidatus Heimdallarchaeota archaeon]
MNKKKIDSTKKTSLILEEIASKSQLKEGKEAVRSILREIYRQGTIGTKSLARKIHLPIPTVAAVRKELENTRLIDRVKKGAILTESGLMFVTKELRISFVNDLLCKTCGGTRIEFPYEFDDIISKLRSFTELRPTPNTSLDQAFGLPITALRRAYFMLQNNDLEGRKILLLGDDDFTSLAIALLNITTDVTVLDIDMRLTDVIEEIADENSYQIKCYNHDLRKPIPDELKGQFDTILTDPPYTIPGLELFLSRAVQALKKEIGRKIYLAFAHRAPNDLFEFQRVITNHGLAFQEMIPGFNLYEGAEIHGNTTSLMVLVTTSNTRTIIEKEYKDMIYTGEIRPTTRIYSCLNKHLTRIGTTEKIKSIEKLKELGCPICGVKDSFTRITKENLE